MWWVCASGTNCIALGSGQRDGDHGGRSRYPVRPIYRSSEAVATRWRQADAGTHHRARPGRGFPSHRAGHQLPRSHDRTAFWRRQSLQVQIEYLREEAPLGTAGAIASLEPRPSLPLLVSNGDVLTDIRYSELLEFHCRHGAAATMAVRLHEWQHPFGVVRTNGVDIVGFDEKPVARTHINAGVYVLEPSAIDSLNLGEPCDMPTLFSRLRAEHARTIVYPMHEPWLDVGREADLERADSAQLRGRRQDGE